MPKEKRGVDLHREWIARDVFPAAPNEYTVFTPDVVCIPMQQHIGAPCKPTVAKGDAVLLGQRVGESDEKMSALVHASVSGRVVDVAEYPQPKGGKGLCVVIENDGKDTPCPPPAACDAENPEDIRKAVQNAGIVGMGGATFPTHIKLDAGGKKIDSLIVNGAECEPGLYADNALMVQHAQEILQGAVFAKRAVGAGRILVGIEREDTQALAAMRAAARLLDEPVEVQALPGLYPQGGEKQLVHSLTQKEIPEGELPAAAGVVVVNVATARAIANAVLHGAPLTRRICTVTGGVAAPQNLCFPIGTQAGALIAACGGFVGAPSKLVAGGPMMGVAFEELSLPLAKGSNGLVVIGEARDAAAGEEPCIRCNRCVEVCPMALVPWKLDRYWRKKDEAGCARFHAQSCINCGCCTYICPAHRALAENIMAARGRLQQREKEEDDG